MHCIVLQRYLAGLLGQFQCSVAGWTKLAGAECDLLGVTQTLA